MGIDFMAPRRGQAKPGETKVAKSNKELEAIEKEKLLRPGSLKTIMGKFDLAMDSEVWTCLVFQDRAQAEAFGKALGKPGDKYIDGRLVAKRLGILLPEPKR